jgi:RNA polymerase sigma-70 factor, ECF subfamily
MIGGPKRVDSQHEWSAGSLHELLARARDGSRSALGHLLMAFRPWLRRRAEVALPKRLSAKCDPSDVVQEVQSEISRTIGQFRGSAAGQFRTWVARILESHILKIARFWGRKRRSPKRELPLNPSLDRVEADGFDSMTNSLLTVNSLEEDRKRFVLAMSFCADEDRKLISLRHFEDKNHHEIAAVLGITVAAARKRYSRAIQRLREAASLIEVLSENGITGPRLEAIVLHRLQELDPKQIAEQLRLPKPLVAQWITDAPRRPEQEK